MKQSEANAQQERECKICKITKPIIRFKCAEGYFRYKCKDCENIELSLKRKLNINGFKEMANERLRRHRKTPRGAMRQRLQAAKKRCKDLNLPLDITLNFLMELYNKQEGKCAITGLELKFIGDFWDVLSIDRIAPDKGYIQPNVQLVINRVNLMKSNMSMEELLYICKLIVEKGSETISKESTPKPAEAPNNQND